MGLREKPVLHGVDHSPKGPDPIPGMGTSIEVTDGVTTIDPVAVLRVGPGLVLTNPTTGEAEIEAFVPQQGVYAGGGVTPASGSEGTESWSLDTGTVSLLDLTSPTAPTMVDDGLYAFTALFASGAPGGGIVAGDMMQATLVVPIDSAGALHFMSLRGDDHYKARLDTLWVTVSGICRVAAGATITGKIFNGTSGTLNFTMEYCVIVRLAA